MSRATKTPTLRAYSTCPPHPEIRALFGAGLHPLSEQRRERLEGPDLKDRYFRAVTRMGVPFKEYAAEATAFQVEVAKRIEDHAASHGAPRDYPVEPHVRARIRSQGPLRSSAQSMAGPARRPRAVRHDRETVPAQDHDGGRVRPDLLPVKSVSTLWAVAAPQVAAQVELAHNEAVADALAFIVEHVLY